MPPRRDRLAGLKASLPSWLGSLNTGASLPTSGMTSAAFSTFSLFTLASVVVVVIGVAVAFGAACAASGTSTLAW